MESKKSDSSNASLIFRLFDEKPSSGLGFMDSPQIPLQPPPPCLEVLPSEVSACVKYIAEPVNVGGVTLLKGRVSTQDVFALANSDLVPGKYEAKFDILRVGTGGLKLWEGSLDLITALSSEIKDGKLSFTGKRVLELGCGHGLPGIFACQKGAASVHFQDFNAEVLQCLTIPNVNANVQKKPDHLATDMNECNNLDTRFFAGDWVEVHCILPHACKDVNEASYLAQLDRASSYDVILMAETVYSISALPNLYRLIKKELCTWLQRSIILGSEVDQGAFFLWLKTMVLLLLLWFRRLQMAPLMCERYGSSFPSDFLSSCFNNRDQCLLA
ncbi:uncharacterized protein [Primulina huaijiensis]|uniref:uncharacterized protein isoform X4 n=2 Tax=Primulina huaijiensis TaxID=1492673 RepID=UPI003CC72AD8